MKLISFFISFFLATQVFCQPVQKVAQLLKERKVGPLISYIDTPQKSNVDYRWKTLRTIVGDYQEGVIEIQENLPANDGTGGSFIKNYSICLLADKERIFYYRFIKEDRKIDSLKDNEVYALFENAFRQVYGNTLHPDDLFLTSIVYGSHCGFAGGNPPYMEKLNELLQANDIDSIRRWLTSPNAEKQLYAVYGYRVLVNQGYDLTDEENRVIDVIKQKKGTVNTCGGCVYMHQKFEDVVSEINSIPVEYLRLEKSAEPGAEAKNHAMLKAKKATVWWGVILVAIAGWGVFYFNRRRKKNI